MNWKQYLPILEWLPKYKRAYLKGDVSAGLTVGIMLIPQGMAYAMLAGLPPIYGLYASILPILLYAIFGSSRHLAVGPVAMVSLLVAAGVGSLTSDMNTYIQLAILLAFMVGSLQFLMGVFRLGFLVNFLSHPVVSGFTSAAALIIGLSQLKHLLGIPIPRSNHVHEIILQALKLIQETNLYTLGIGLAAIAIMLFIKKIKFLIPGPLVIVVVGILSVWALGLDQYGVQIVKNVPKGLPEFSLPSFDLVSVQKLIPFALTIAFISFMESIAVAKAVQNKHKNYEIVPNQELLALGIANIGGAFLQSFPTTGGFSRTAVNDQAGANTGLAAIFSAGLIMLTLLFLTPLFYYLPNAILAAIIMVAVFGLIDFNEAKNLWNHYRPDFWMWAVTFSGTLVLGIEEGVLIGVILSIAMIIYQTTKPHIAVLGKIPGKPHYRNIERFKQLEERSDVLIIRFDARLYYANVSYFLETSKKLIQQKGDALKLFILDADSINGIDSTGMHALEDLANYCRNKEIRFQIAGLKGPIRDLFHSFGLFQNLEPENFFFRIQHAVDAFDNHSKKGRYQEYALQNNNDFCD